MHCVVTCVWLQMPTVASGPSLSGRPGASYMHNETNCLGIQGVDLRNGSPLCRMSGYPHVVPTPLTI